MVVVGGLSAGINADRVTTSDANPIGDDRFVADADPADRQPDAWRGDDANAAGHAVAKPAAVAAFTPGMAAGRS